MNNPALAGPRDGFQESDSFRPVGKRILLVEDSPTQAASLVRFLEEHGLEVTQAASAEAGLKWLESKRPHAILLDNNLPTMTGNDFCREIRLNVNTRAIPVLMLTSETSSAAQVQGLASGADDYVVKSVDRDILLARVHALLRKSRPEAVPDVESRFVKARILVIDDNPDDLDLIREVLKNEHYTLEFANSAEAGLRRTRDAVFDCVLIDFEMPELNGAEICRRIRESAAKSETETILIIYSSHDAKHLLREAFAAGADDYISKGFDFSLTKARINALLRRKFLIEENHRIFEDMRQKELAAVEARAHREMIEFELEVAREVQQRLFPQNLPPCATLDYAAQCRPASSVGGDYYDFLMLPDGQLGLAIGDVSGKGIPAALMMASFQASVRGNAYAAIDSVSQFMTRLNNLLLEASPGDRYTTFVYARYDPVTRMLTYSNAGHNRPMVLRGSDVLHLDKGGLPIGLVEAAEYDQESVQLQQGDLLVMFTDGFIEAGNSARTHWGESRLLQAVRDCASLRPKEMIESILAAADGFVDGAPQYDDMTLVVARVL